MNFSRWLTAAIFKQQPSGLKPERDAEQGIGAHPPTKPTHHAALPAFPGVLMVGQPSLQLGPCVLVVKVCTGLQNSLAKRG